MSWARRKSGFQICQRAGVTEGGLNVAPNQSITTAASKAACRTRQVVKLTTAGVAVEHSEEGWGEGDIVALLGRSVVCFGLQVMEKHCNGGAAQRPRTEWEAHLPHLNESGNVLSMPVHPGASFGIQSVVQIDFPVVHTAWSWLCQLGPRDRPTQCYIRRDRKDFNLSPLPRFTSM